jgi:hypothetical protein
MRKIVGIRTKSVSEKVIYFISVESTDYDELKEASIKVQKLLGWEYEPRWHD